MNRLFSGTLEQLMDQLPTAAICKVYEICESMNFPEDRVINVQITNGLLLVW